jgi:hypothetical protein
MSMNILACTICGQPAFATIRVEIDRGAATYIVCPNSQCIQTAGQRAVDNLWNAANKQRATNSVIDAPSQLINRELNR